MRGMPDAWSWIETVLLLGMVVTTGAELWSPFPFVYVMPMGKVLRPVADTVVGERDDGSRDAPKVELLYK